MLNRIEEFTQNGRNFIYFDLSGLKSNEGFSEVIELSKPIVAAYQGRPLYSITNIADITFDTKTKKIVAQWTAHNKPFVKYGVVIGMDSIKQIMVNAIFTLSGRKNMSFASTKEKAIEWLLKQD